MKKLKILLLIVIIISIAGYFLTKPKFKEYHQNYTSPDGKYILKVYVQTNMFTISLHGEESHRSAYVQLEDQKGNVIAKPGIFGDCNFQIGDLYVEWIEKENKVLYGRKYRHIIDLSTMEMTCN